MTDNPFDGISDVGNTAWTSKVGSQPVNLVESMKAMFEQIQEKERGDHERLMEWGRANNEWKKDDPLGYEAHVMASLEIFGRQGDPVNPVIAHPKQVERYHARVKERLATPDLPFRAGG